MILKTLGVSSLLYLLFYIIFFPVHGEENIYYQIYAIFIPYLLTGCIFYFFIKNKKSHILNIVPFIAILFAAFFETITYFMYNIFEVKVALVVVSIVSSIWLAIKHRLYLLNAVGLILLLHTVILPPINKWAVKITDNGSLREGQALDGMQDYFMKIRFLNYWETKVLIAIAIILALRYAYKQKNSPSFISK